MRRHLALLTLLALATACQPLGLTAAGDKGDRTIKARPAAKVSAAPSTAPSAAAVRYDVLQRPAGTVKVLKGRVAIDAHYAVQVGKGRLLGQAGTNAIAAGGGNLAGQAGTNAVAAGGGNLAGQASTNVVLMEGSPLLGQAGTNAIAAGGGNLVGQSGTNAIAAGGGNLLGQAGTNMVGNRRYMIAAEDSALNIGAMLAAGGMEISAYDMKTGELLTLGTDGEGRDVLSIFSDATGAFTVFLPDHLKDTNIRLVAQSPAADDARLAYQLLVPPTGTAERLMDEDTSLVATYFVEAFTSRIERLFVQRTDDDHGATYEGFVGDQVPVALRPLFAPVMTRLDAAVVKAEVVKLSPADRRRLARKTAEALLAHIQLETLSMQVNGQPANVIEVLRGLLQEARSKTALKLAERAAFDAGFRKAIADTSATMNSDVNRIFAGPEEVVKPSDFGAFILNHIFTSPNRTKVTYIVPLLEVIDMPASAKDRLNDAMNALLTALGITLMQDPAALEAVAQSIEAGL